ncbi:hypothetical protein V8C26DRAFT_327750 [Trichoderma gracile]
MHLGGTLVASGEFCPQALPLCIDDTWHNSCKLDGGCIGTNLDLHQQVQKPSMRCIADPTRIPFGPHRYAHWQPHENIARQIESNFRLLFRYPGGRIMLDGCTEHGSRSRSAEYGPLRLPSPPNLPSRP